MKTKKNGLKNNVAENNNVVKKSCNKNCASKCDKCSSYDGVNEECEDGLRPTSCDGPY